VINAVEGQDIVRPLADVLFADEIGICCDLLQSSGNAVIGPLIGENGIDVIGGDTEPGKQFAQ
jgi:hypothetical protein